MLALTVKRAEMHYIDFEGVGDGVHSIQYDLKFEEI